MEQQQVLKRWRAWALAGMVALGTGGLATRPAPAAPGFGVRGAEERERPRAGQQQRVEERRQQERTRDAEHQAERERVAQERAHQGQQRAAERQAQHDARIRAEEERAAREAQARAEARQQQGRWRPGFGVREPSPTLLPNPTRDQLNPTRSPNNDPGGGATHGGEASRAEPRRPGWGVRNINPLLPRGANGGGQGPSPIHSRRDGSLDRYFNPGGGNVGYRPPRQREHLQRENTAYREEHHRRLNDRYYPPRPSDCLYERIYVSVPVLVPVIEERVRTEVVVTPPTTVVVPVPERADGKEPRVEEQRPRESPSRMLARVIALEEVFADIERAWLTETIDLLMRHVRTDCPLEIYRDGDFSGTLSWEEFRDRTQAAFAQYETLSMQFDAPRFLSETEAVAAAEHRYRAEGKVRRARVVFALTRERGAWWVLGIDFVELPAEETGAAAGEELLLHGSASGHDSSGGGVNGAGAHGGADPAPRADAPTKASLVWAPPIRWSTLLSKTQPMRIATVKAISGGSATLYDLKAMRGIHPGTLAWALYRRGEARPLRIGVLEPENLHPETRLVACLTPTAAPITHPAAGQPALFPLGSRTAGFMLALAEIGRR